MKKFWKPRHETHPIDEMVDLAAKGKLSRRRFVASMTALGASATAITTFAIASQQMGRRTSVTRPAATPQEQQNINAHDTHLSTRQNGVNGTPTPTPTPNPQSNANLSQHLNAIIEDYHPDAVVEDMLMGVPIQGHVAIRERKLQEFMAMRGLNIQIVDRFSAGDQVVAEWLATGTLTGTFLGVTGDQVPFTVRGLTVVTRQDGKIVRESLYYDLDEVHRQLNRSIPTPQ